MSIGIGPSWTANNKRIFIIETDEIVRSALQFMLSDGNETHALESLEQAYAVGKSWKPDLIVLGLAVVRQRGLRVFGDIAARLPHAKLLLVADSPDDPLARACLSAGADDVLGKPIALEPVSAKIDVLLGAGKLPGMSTITSAAGTTTGFDEILDNFSLLAEWDDRYRYVIELGHGLSPLPEQERNAANKVQGCASQVWLATTVSPCGEHGSVLTFRGDSDAHIVRGLIAILLAMCSGRQPRDILAIDASAQFERLGLREHLTPQRSNGLRSMVERIRRDAQAALAGAA